MLETPGVVELKWEKRPGIYQTDRYLKSNIERVEIDTKEDIQFRNMGQLLPSPDRLTPEDYQRRIAKCTAFLDLYPNGTHSEKVKLMLKTLEEESEKAAAGGLKLDSKWIDPQTRQENAYAIDANIEFADMVAAKESSNFKLTMRHFDKIRADFSSSENYSKARALAIETLRGYQPALQLQIGQVDIKRQERERARATLPLNVRAENKAAQDKADSIYLKLVDRETSELKTKWLSLNEYHSDPMRKVLNALKNTLSTLENETDPEEQVFAGPLYRDAWNAARRDDPEAGKEIIGELKSLKVPSRYLDALEEAFDSEEESEPEAEVEPEPEAEAEVEVEPEAEAESEAEAEPEAEPTPEASTKQNPLPAKADSPANSSDTSSPPADSAGSSKTQVILVILLVLVILGALAAAFIGKKKK